MRNKIMVSFITLIILVVLLFVNILLLGFTHRLMAFYFQWILILLITLISIDLMLLKLKGWLSVLLLITIGITLTAYYYKKQDLRFMAEMIFFNERKEKVNQVIDFINTEYTAGRKINKDSLTYVVNKIGFDGLQINKNYIAVKVGSGYNGIIGFIYTRNPKPRILFGEYVNPREKIEDNWYRLN